MKLLLGMLKNLEIKLLKHCLKLIIEMFKVGGIGTVGQSEPAGTVGAVCIFFKRQQKLMFFEFFLLGKNKLTKFIKKIKTIYCTTREMTILYLTILVHQPYNFARSD